MNDYLEYLNSIKYAIMNIESDTYKTRKMLSKMKDSFNALSLSDYNNTPSLGEVYLTDYGVYEDPDDLELIRDISTEEANELYKWYDEALEALDNMNFYAEKYSQLLTLFEEAEYIFEGIEDDN